MAKEWYVIHTYSGHENKVKAALERAIEDGGLQEDIFQVKIPTVEVPDVKDGKKVFKSKKFFPGYVLVEMVMGDVAWYTVRNIKGVTNFVGAIGTNRPKPLSRSEVDSLFGHVDKDGNAGRDDISISADFSIGEPVKVVEGPFSNFNGIVEEVFPEKGRLRVKVEIFGRGTPVELDFFQVDKI